MFPSRFRCQSVDGIVAFHFKFHRNATDKLLKPLVGRIVIEQHGIDLFTPARARDVASVDPRANRGGSPVPVDAFDVGTLRLVPTRRWICNGVVDPALLDDAHDTMSFLVVVVAEGVGQQLSEC